MEVVDVVAPEVVAAKEAFIPKLEELNNEQAKTLFFFNTSRLPTRQRKRTAIQEYMALLKKAQTKEEIARIITDFFRDARIQTHASRNHKLFDPTAPYEKKLKGAPDSVKKFINFLTGEARNTFEGIVGTNTSIHQNIFFPDHSGLIHKITINKFLVTDRDDTILNSKEQLINPDFVCNLVKTITEAPDMQWAIASRGAMGFIAEDAAYQRIVERYPTVVDKQPFYPIVVGLNSLLNCCPEEGRQSLQAFFKAEDKQPFLDKQWMLQLGQTTFTFSAAALDEAHERLLVGGDYKLFSVLAALDLAQLRVGLTDKLRAFGITGIAAPEHYEMIDSKDVVFMDDKLRNCEALSAAGFTAIHADTPEFTQRYQKENTREWQGPVNTYMEKISATLENKPVAAFRMGGL